MKNPLPVSVFQHSNPDSEETQANRPLLADWPYCRVAEFAPSVLPQPSCASSAPTVRRAGPSQSCGVSKL